MWRGVIYGSREAITAPVKWGGSLMFDDVRKADGSEYSMGHVKGGALGDGSFDLLTNMWRVPSHEALAAATGRVLRIEVRTGSVTLPGGVQARGVLRGYRRTTTRPVRAHARPPH